MSSAYVYTGLCSILCGVLYASLFSVTLFSVAFLMILSAACSCCAVLFLIRPHRASVGVCMLCAVAFLGCAIGTVRFYMAEEHNTHDPFHNNVGEEVSLRGVIDMPIDSRDDFKWVVMFVDDAEVRIRIFTNHFPPLSYGDELHIVGTLEYPEDFETETGRTFRYVSFLRKDNIQYVMWRPEIEVTGHVQGNYITRSLFALKDVFKQRIDRALPEPFSALANGILLGSKQGLGEDLEQAFRDTGLIHIVVLSGFNVTIVALFVLWIFSFLPFYIARGLALTSIIAFAILVGGGATVVRASIMASLAVFAPVVHRQYNIHRSLGLAGVGMVLLNPYVLVFDPSFQLSFVATIGLIYFGPILSDYVQFITPRWGVRDIVVATTSTQIFVLPLLLYMIGEISIVALPVNLLTLPVIPIAMLASFMVGLAGLLSSFLAQLFAYPAFLFLAYVIEVVRIFAVFPYATLSAPPFPAWVLVLAYIGVLLFVFRWWRVHNPEPTVFSSIDALVDRD